MDRGAESLQTPFRHGPLAAHRDNGTTLVIDQQLRAPGTGRTAPHNRHGITEGRRACVTTSTARRRPHSSADYRSARKPALPNDSTPHPNNPGDSVQRPQSHIHLTENIDSLSVDLFEAARSTPTLEP
ncbi:hypothetical protein GCM10023318_55380 [Nocardia callitridis]|uniref:Uncharacterized protein n=1 Tax=Nocardia callitridis TaxID=648753 RepID=A0ABP9KZB2_9NOCA